MIVRRGSLVSAERTSLTEWRNLIVGASVRQDPEQIETLAEFELDRDNFVYVRTRAVSAYEMHGANQNGDAFRAEVLANRHKTFVRRGAYLNHESDSPEKAIGIILDATWHPKEGFVQTLIAVDKAEPIADKIAKGLANTWSMGALVPYCVCSVCDKKASTEAEYCDCLKTAMGKTWNGKKVFAFNEGDVSFYEESNVTVPADPNAYTLQVLASRQDDFAFLPAQLRELADEYDRKIAALRQSKEVVSDVRGKLQTQTPDKNILGKVRHKLKVAKAPLLPKTGEPVHRRVQAALEAVSASAEKMNSQNQEPITNNPLEGIKVENTLTIQYVPGDSLEDCIFVARKGKLQAMTTAAKILDASTQKAIVASEQGAKKHADMTSGTPNEGKIKDESKPSPDTTLDVGKDPVGQPKDKVNELSAKPAKELKDESKSGGDTTHTLGKDPIQPSDVVKKYAQLIGASRVSFKKGANGSFKAVLDGGSIARLASLWQTTPRPVRDVQKTAKIAGEPMIFAREDARPEKTPMRQMPLIAREDKSSAMAKASGSTGSETKSYYQQHDNGTVAGGDDSNWARRASELTKVAQKLEDDLKAVKAENDVLKATIQAHVKASDDKEKHRLISAILGCMERSGALAVDENDVIDLQEKGFGFEDAQRKAYANLKDRKVAELKDLDVKALDAMAKNLSDLAPKLRTEASNKNSTMPLPSRDEFADASEDALSRMWDR